MIGDRLTGKQRLGILLSFIWLSLVAMWASLGWAGFEWGGVLYVGDLSPCCAMGDFLGERWGEKKRAVIIHTPVPAMRI